jgi:hypothetical protein
VILWEAAVIVALVACCKASKAFVERKMVGRKILLCGDVLLGRKVVV